MMKIMNQYFKYILPCLILLLLGRESVVFFATPNEHHLRDVSFFAPRFIENDKDKAAFANKFSAYIGNKKFVHARYKACSQQLLRFAIFDQPKQEAQRLKCIEILDEALLVAPSSPLIWLEKAKLHLAQQNLAAFNAALLNAWRVAPRQNWVMRGRIEMSLQNWNDLSEVNKLNSEADFLKLAVVSENVVKSLARHYWLNPEVKFVAQDWVTKTDVETQRKFVSFIRAAR